IEAARKKCNQLAEKKSASQSKALTKLLATFQNKNTQELHEIAIAYSLMLELINRCETAYRTHRLRNRSEEKSNRELRSRYALIYVFTAHPTEARSEEVLTLFKIIENSLQKALDHSFSDVKEELAGYLK